MNRFRKKSGTKKGNSNNKDEDTLNQPSPSPSPPFPLLPEVNDFRTSLILPHLTRRFTLLRKEDGKLVSLEEMQLHLAAQRKTGMLTASEVDAALLQFSYQAQAEEPIPTPRAWPINKRRDWSIAAGTTTNDSEESIDLPPPTRRSREESYISTATSNEMIDHSTTSSSSPTSLPTPSSSSIPNSATSNSFASTSNSHLPSSFPYSSESYYSLPTPTPPAEAVKVEPYKRGAGNSMFGGRVRQMKVSKSPSSFSLKSSASASSKKSGRTTQTNDTGLEGDGGLGEGEGEEGETGDDKSSRTRDSTLGTEDEADDASVDRLGRVSLALDDIESELSKTYLRMTEENDLGLDGGEDEEEERLSRIGAYQEERSVSPIGSDTEPIDPFFHRLRPTTISRKLSRNFPLTTPPSTSTLSNPTSPSASFDNPILQPPSKPFAYSNSPSLNTLSSDRDGSERDVSTPVQHNSSTFLSSSSLSTSPIQSSSSSPYSPSQLLARSYNSTSRTTPTIPAFTHPFDEATKSRIESQTYSNQSHDSGSLDEFPDSYNFPTPSTRNGSTSTKGGSISIIGGGVGGGDNSDEGPFDLTSARGSLASKGSLSSRSKPYGMDSRRRAYAATSTSTSTGAPSTIFVGPFRNDSMSSVGSVGSSYHPVSAGSEEDDESGLPKEKLGEEGEGKEMESLKIPDHLPVSRVLSKEELLQDLRSNGLIESQGSSGSNMNMGGGGEEQEDVVPIEVEDLVLIQESLVRSASRRAALRAATPSLHSSSSPSINQTDSRKHSIETTEEGSLLPARKTSVDDGNSLEGSRGGLSSKRPSYDEGLQEEEVLVEGSNSDHQSVHSITPSSFPTPSSIDSREFASAVTSPVVASLTTLPEIALVPAVGDQFNSEAVPRSPLPSHSPIVRQSVLIRDVRTQANTATTNLKSKTPPQFGNSIKRKKSVRNLPISNPSFVSGPTGIPAVPIINSMMLESSDVIIPPVPRSPKAISLPKLGPKSESRNSVTKAGIGSRFKKLLSQKSREQLNGDEVTPFMDVEANSISPPFSPPPSAGAETSSFGSSPRSPPPTSPILLTPEVPALPEAFRNPLSTSVTESMESAIGGDSPSSTRSLSRVLSRFRTTSRRPSDTASTIASGSTHSATEHTAPTMPGSPALTLSGRSPIITPRSINRNISGGDSEGLGLGLGRLSPDSGSRALVTYDVGSMRRRRTGGEIDYDELPQTAPLSLSRASPMADQMDNIPRSAPLDRPIGRRMSSESMNQLTEAAQDLGLEPDGVEELVNLSYNNNNNTRQDVMLNGQPLDTPEEEASDMFTPTILDFRHPDAHSASRSFQERVSTPPPTLAHRRKSSVEALASNTPVPRIPEGLAKKLVVDQRMSRLSVDTKGSGSISNGISGSPRLLPPRSPGGNSIRSYRSSGYAGSVFDFYGDDGSDDGGQGVVGADLIGNKSNGNGGLRMEEQNGIDYPARRDAAAEEEGEEEDLMGENGQQDGSNVWTVVDDLRKHRLSTNSTQSQSDPNYAFHSRQSSNDSGASYYPPPPPLLPSTTSPTHQSHLRNGSPTPSSTNSVEPPQLFLRHHGRNRSSQSNIDESNTSSARFPSIYVRDEKRLNALEDGIATEESGNFFTRSIGTEELARLKEIRMRERGVKRLEMESQEQEQEVGSGYQEEES